MIHLEEFNQNMGQSLLELITVVEKNVKYLKREILIKEKLTSFKIKSKKSQLITEFYKKISNLSNFEILSYFVKTFYLDWHDTVAYCIQRKGCYTYIYKGQVGNCQEVFINGEIYSITC